MRVMFICIFILLSAYSYSEESSDNEVEKKGYYLEEDRFSIFCDGLSGGCTKEEGTFCSEMLENLKYFDDGKPAIAERKYNEDLGFTKPEWKSIPRSETNWSYIKQYFEDNFLELILTEEQEEAVLKTWHYFYDPITEIPEEEPILWVSEFNIDNRGDSEIVYRFKRGNYIVNENPNSTQSTPLYFIVNKDGSFRKRKIGEFLDAVEYFFYDGNTYSSRWGGSGEPNQGFLIVKKMNNATGKAITGSGRIKCKYRFYQ